MLRQNLHRLGQWASDRRRARWVAMGAALLVVVALAVLFGPSFLVPPSALASTTTLTILSGSAEVQTAGRPAWVPGRDGMTLNAGDRVRTRPQSHALITFFEGSTVQLDPETDLTIQALQAATDRPTTMIRLKQWVGTTWSRVVQLADPSSRYEVETPAAVALIRGTLLHIATETDGTTQVRTVEGSVEVVSQQASVIVGAGFETTVAPGQPPEPPKTSPPPTIRSRWGSTRPSGCCSWTRWAAASGWCHLGWS